MTRTIAVPHLNIERGSIGSTRLLASHHVGEPPAEVAAFTWAGVTSGRNSFVVDVASDPLTCN